MRHLLLLFFIFPEESALALAVQDAITRVRVAYNSGNGGIALAEQQGSDCAHGAAPQSNSAGDAVLPQVSYCCFQVIYFMCSQGDILTLRSSRPLYMQHTTL